MKKIIFVLALFLASVMMVNAQFEKGSIMLGASSSISLVNSGSEPISPTGSGLISIGLSKTTITEEYPDFQGSSELKQRQFNLSPKAGYFFIDNFAAGAGVNLGRSVSITNDDGEYTTTLTLLLFEPFLRYYIPLNKIVPFFELKGGLGTLKDKYQYENDDPTDYKHPVSTLGAGLGVSFPVGMNASFDVMAGYNMLNRKYEDTDFDYKETYKSEALGIEFGFRVFFGGYGLGSADSSY